jgi:hypothetical protein
LKNQNTEISSHTQMVGQFSHAAEWDEIPWNPPCTPETN